MTDALVVRLSADPKFCHFRAIRSGCLANRASEDVSILV